MHRVEDGRCIISPPRDWMQKVIEMHSKTLSLDVFMELSVISLIL